MVAAISAQGSHFETFDQLRDQFLSWWKTRPDEAISTKRNISKLLPNQEVGISFLRLPNDRGTSTIKRDLSFFHKINTYTQSNN
jgi:hypothetical protein